MNTSEKEYRLTSAIMANSEAKSWKEARSEWDVVFMEEDDSLEESCVCGYEGLRYLYTIQNRKNGHELFPIGSECVRKFDSTSMNEQVTRWGIIARLADMADLPWKERTFYKAKDLKALNRKFLESLDDTGAITPSKYNDYKPFHDKWFLIDMFNKRDPMTSSQMRKANALTGQLIRWASNEIEGGGSNK